MYSISHSVGKDRGWIGSDDRRARGLYRWWHGLGYVSTKFMAEEALRVDVLTHSGVKGGPNKAQEASDVSSLELIGYHVEVPLLIDGLWIIQSVQ